MNKFNSTNIEGLKACKIRDISYFQFGDNTIALAVDSEGSVGCRKKDQFNKPLEAVVPLMIEVIAKEMICMGGEPIAIYIDFSTRDDEYNQKIIKIIKETIKGAGFDPDIVKASFGEYDGEVEYSLMGLSIVGAIRKEVRTESSQPGDLVYCVALPNDRFDMDKYITLKTVKEILELPYVHEVLPGGSHGILNEAEQLAETNGLEFIKGNNKLINDQEKESCGGACAVLVSIDKNYKDEFENLQLPNSINLFGTLEGIKTDSIKEIIGSKTECSLLEDGTLAFKDGYQLTQSTMMSYGVGNNVEDFVKEDDYGAYGVSLVKKAIEKNEAEPAVVINNLTFGMEPNGKKEIKAIVEYLSNKYPGIDTKAQFTGSTEDNMTPGVTAFAIRVLGLNKK